MGLFNFSTKSKNYQNLYCDELEKIIREESKKNYEIIDVRTPEEYKSGHIPGAKNINILSPDFTSKVEKLGKSKNFYVYCRSGSRSASACAQMSKLGFENLYNLVGGTLGWQGDLV